MKSSMSLLSCAAVIPMTSYLLKAVRIALVASSGFGSVPLGFRDCTPIFSATSGVGAAVWAVTTALTIMMENRRTKRSVLRTGLLMVSFRFSFDKGLGVSV